MKNHKAPKSSATKTTAAPASTAETTTSRISAGVIVYDHGLERTGISLVDSGDGYITACDSNGLFWTNTKSSFDFPDMAGPIAKLAPRIMEALRPFFANIIGGDGAAVADPFYLAKRKVLALKEDLHRLADNPANAEHMTQIEEAIEAVGNAECPLSDASANYLSAEAEPAAA
jgi:hypothetical protein